MEPNEDSVCADCTHKFHAGRCFWTDTVGNRYLDCRCKKGVLKDAD